MRGLIFILLGTLFSGSLLSSHIVGGEILYDHLKDSVYRITLKVYRDCANGGLTLDGVPGPNMVPAMITVYTGDSILVGTYNIGAPTVSQVSPSINNPCVQPPSGICVEEGIYTFTLILPPRPKGYYVIYQRCCRNATIVNLQSPGMQGSTYYTYIPGPEKAPVNSSPRFNKFPPIFICNKVAFSFNHAATDPDGDQLVYSLCAPYQGLDHVCGSIASQNCPTLSLPPPYPSVNYNGSYSGSYPIASNPAFSINPSTGVLSGRPGTQGQFVVCVCVQEFRNNVLLNVHYRDFQFNVVGCVVQAAANFSIPVLQCQGMTMSFTNTSFGNMGNLSYLWDFGVPSLSTDSSSLNHPTYTYPDTGQYVVTLIVNPNKPCSDTVQSLVYIYPKLDIQLPSTAAQCFKNNLFTFQAQGAFLPYTKFSWTFGAAATPVTSTLSNPGSVSYSQPGKYILKLLARHHNCADSVTDTIRVYAPPLAKINNLPQSLCDPAHIGFSNGSSSELPASYTWHFSNGSSSTLYEPVVIFSPAGIYQATLIVRTTSVCVDSSVASVKDFTVKTSPTAAFSFSPQPTTIFDPQISFINFSSADVTNWHYKLGDGSESNNPSFTHEYQQPGDYHVTQSVNNSYNCFDTLSQIVKILPEFRFWIPNTFTPDDNSRNDLFMPVTIGISDYDFEVYDEWGNKIFHTQNPSEGWDGYHEGKECQQDVYVWRVAFKNTVESSYHVRYGRVQLLKNR